MSYWKFIYLKLLASFIQQHKPTMADPEKISSLLEKNVVSVFTGLDNWDK